MTRYATEYGAFCIEQIPNQPQLAHCHSFHIKDEFKGKGLAKQLKLFQCHVLQTLSFDYATCTTAGDNIRQHRVLEGLGWERKDEFKNSATGSTTILWGWKVRPVKAGA